MKKFTSTFAVVFLLVFSVFVKAQCPTSMAFLGGDTNYVYNQVGAPFTSGVTMACNAMPFWIWANQPATLSNANQDIYTPCIKTNYDRYWTTTRNNGTESFYEAGSYLNCIGPSGGCAFPIGTSTPMPLNGTGIWDLYFSYLDETQTHDMVFTKPAAVAWNTHTVTVADCWSDVALPSVVATPINWTGTMTSWTVSVPANTPIGNGTFTLNPPVAGAITDVNYGYVYVRPRLLPAGTYTMTYNFSGSECPGGTNGTFIFTITNPYNATWTAPTNLCTNAACVSLPPTVSGTAGGTWSGSGVSGSTFCPGTSGAGNFGVTYSVGISPTCNAVQTNSIMVNATPTVSVAGGTICSGQSIVLTNTGPGAGSYTWSPTGGSAGSATVSPTGTTTYTLTAANSNCTNSGTAVVNVTPPPTVSISSSVGTTLCSGASTTLTAGGATNYTWSPNAGGGNTSPIVVTPGSTDTYTLTGETGGCTSTQVITVNVTPTPIVTASAGAPAVCLGSGTTITAGGATNYTLMPGGSTTNPFPVTPGGNTTYTITGETGGCVSTQTVDVTVNPLPTITLGAAPSSLCSGQTTTLTAGGATTYTWSANAGGGNTSPVSVTPGASDTYTVTGTDNNGCVNAQTITVNVGGGATIGIATSSNTVCVGQPITLNGSGAANYTWSPGGQTTGTITVNPGVGSTTYTLTGDNGGGCIGSETVTVSAIANPTVTPSASSAAICSNGSTTLTASGATNYTWMPGGSTTSPLPVNPGTTTTYTLTGETNGCTANSTITINVTATPTVTASASGGTICAGQNVVLTGGGAGTYTWLPGGSTNGTVTVTPTGSTTYTLTGANGTCTANANASVTVTPLPVLTATTSLASFCSGSPTGVILTGAGATTYTWSTNAGGVNTATASVNPGATDTYTVTGTTNGCSNAAQVSVTVVPTPTLSVSATATAICAGQSTNINAGGATSYTWMPGGSNTASTSVSPATTQNYTVTGETGGCTTTGTVDVVVYPSPILGAAAGTDTAKCGISTGGILGVSVTGGTPGYTYQWLPSGPNNDSLTNMPAGSYTVIVTDANGCVATGGSGIFTIPGTPPVTAVVTPPLTTGQAPLTVVFTGTASVNATGYTWNMGNGTASTQPNPSATYTAAGTYVVTMMATGLGGCWDTTAAIVIIDQPTVIVIPNIFSPNGDGINDDFLIFNTGLSSLQCEIFNRWGQFMFTLDAPQAVWDGKTPNGSDASEGTYYYILKAVGVDGKKYEKEGPLTLVK